jgi:hypothetical protein
MHMATWPNKKQHNNGQSRPNDNQSLNDRFDMIHMAQSDLCHRLERAEYTIEQLLKVVEILSKSPPGGGGQAVCN